MGELREPDEQSVEDRARELVDGGGEGSERVVEDDPQAARVAARAILEESEERTFDPATVDPEDASVIRRTSDEPASNGTP